MDTEQRLDRLEDAHRALAAQHMALQTICLGMLPLITADPALVRRVLLSAYDVTNEEMAKQQLDDEFQADVRLGMDRLSDSVLAGADIFLRLQTPNGSNP